MASKNNTGISQDSVFGLVFSLRDLNISSNELVPVPLQNINISANIVDFVSEVTVTQTYVNVEDSPIEASYMFPIEEEAAVTFFEAEIDGRIILTEVKEKEEARKEYDDAVQRQNTAVLLEETQPDIFQIKLGQLKPGAGAKVTLKYICELPLDDSKIRLTIPTTIAPRYVSPTDSSESAATIASIPYSMENPAPLKINVEGIMQSKVNSVQCPSHKLKTEIEKEVDSRGQFVFHGKLSAQSCDMDRDFILLIEGEDSEELNRPVVYLEKSEEGEDNHGLVGMVSLVPSFRLKEQPTEFIFLVDRSGSMGSGWGHNGVPQSGIEQAKRALELFLHSLPVNCYFNIWSFGSSFNSIFCNGSVKYSDDSMRQAIQHVRDMSANYGGTEIYAPLNAIFEQNKPTNMHLRQIFVLTDGAVSNAPTVISLVKQNKGDTRLFSLGLGSCASRHLVKGIARAGGGTAMFAREEEDLRPKVMSQLKNALQPAITDINISWDDMSHNSTSEKNNGELTAEVETKKTLLGYMKPKKTKDGKKIKQDENTMNLVSTQIPSKVPPVFDGQRLLMYYKFDHVSSIPRKVEVVAQSPDGPLSIELDIQKSNILENGNFVRKLAARKQIQELEESQILDRYGNMYGGSRDDIKIKQAVIKLGVENGLASSYTSFVGVDEYTKKRTNEGLMVTRNVRNQIPSNFGAFGFSGSYVSNAYAPSAMYAAAPNYSCAKFAPMSMPLMQHCSNFSTLNSAPLISSIQSQPAQRQSQPISAQRQSQRHPATPRMPAEKYWEKSGTQLGPRLNSPLHCLRSPMKYVDSNDSDASGILPTNTINLHTMQLVASQPHMQSPQPPCLDAQMTRLINLQNYNGSFTCSEESWNNSVFQVYSGSFENVSATKPENASLEVWTTALAIKILELKMVEKKDIWELVVTKGMQFIMHHFNHSQAEYEKLMKNAETNIKNGNSNGEVHYGAACDGCKIQPIVGPRFKCLICPDYDLCSQCKSRSMHSDHGMQKVVPT